MSAETHSQLPLLLLDIADIWYLIDATVLTTENWYAFHPIFSKTHNIIDSTSSVA